MPSARRSGSTPPRSGATVSCRWPPIATPSSRRRASDRRMTVAAPFVDFRDVWLAYSDELLAEGTFAVEDISMQIGAGEFVAIVGPSGCGKSTFMKLATGLKRPSRGTVIIDGREVAGPLRITGMAFQSS